jgi:hypothetical protein
MTTTPTQTDLADVRTGRYAVTTVSGSEYAIDLDKRTLTRRPDQENDLTGDLRRDGETVELLGIERCIVGARGVFVIDLNVPGVPFTVRGTTEVASISQLA